LRRGTGLNATVLDSALLGGHLSRIIDHWLAGRFTHAAFRTVPIVTARDFFARLVRAG